ncbi:glycosyltransferase [Salinimicrobium sediminilitoris]|uniref:glycosyltransferase n=1 Tax=Salinimicrobium sediminilitoris TaxID=2876715 RepID=UPI001E4B3DA9|nr:glycosyltransferase [Salinimicrobium sediminilitoris]MCC8358760.1 glycosyltransferase [Salinimicrobium sediminilitoris]
MLSLILLSYHSNERLQNVYHSVSNILSKEDIKFELIIIDDGSTDNSFQIAKQLELENKNVKAFQLSKNYSSHYAIFAGLEVSQGDCAMPIPDDEQQPYASIVDMYRLWENGSKVIIPYREKRNDGVINDLLSNTYYKIINLLSDVNFPKGGADSFFIDRELIDLINQRIHPINTSSIIEVLRLGFSPEFYPYERVKGVNTKSRWTLRKKVRLFKDTFFSSSTWPVKVITNLGLFFSLVAFLIILSYTYIRYFGNPLFWGELLPGWTSTIVIVSFFSGLILFSLGIIAEYIWRIYEEVKDRPGYIIKK